jgi:hypothetical protein
VGTLIRVILFLRKYLGIPIIFENIPEGQKILKITFEDLN